MAFLVCRKQKYFYFLYKRLHSINYISPLPQHMLVEIYLDVILIIVLYHFKNPTIISHPLFFLNLAHYIVNLIDVLVLCFPMMHTLRGQAQLSCELKLWHFIMVIKGGHYGQCEIILHPLVPVHWGPNLLILFSEAISGYFKLLPWERPKIM